MNCNIVLGIDLGTTYSVVAYINQHGRPEIIPNREGERITPSVVLFDADTPLVGTIAKRSAVTNPLSVCQFVKRQMGEKNWRFLTENDKEYTPEEISALILRRLKEDAETALGCKVKEVVITVPAYFNDNQRKSTQDAGIIAGFNVLQIINEPTAAALAYGIDQNQEQTIMVYDLGGGTFDVTIMRIHSGEIEVIATGGDRNLGGFNWDNNIMEFLNEEFIKAGGIDLLNNIALQQDLREKTEIAKKTLSSRESTKVFLTGEGKNMSIILTREDFDRVSSDLIRRTETLMDMTLEDAQMTWSDIDKILLVGGSTRMKSVQSLIEKVSCKKPSSELHPDEAVAIGAALLGGILKKKSDQSSASYLDKLPNIRITDVNSHSLGVVALDSVTGQLYNSIILPKDSKIPTRISKVYGTIVDNQTEIEVEVTEGEEEDMEFVHIIGTGSMHIPPYPKGSPLEVFFQYDNNGIIVVTILDMTANCMLGEVHIERQSNRSIAEITEMTKKIADMDIQ